MSATAAKNKKSNQPALVTTGQGAALSVTLGIVMLSLGLMWLISMMADPNSSEVLRQMALLLYGLGGPMCPGLSLLLIWGGVKLLVSTRHRVAVRDVFIVAALYWLVLAGYTLIARVMQGVSNPSYLEYVGNVNFQGVNNLGQFTDYLYLSFKLDTKTGGLLGMLLAYPLWKLLTRPGAIVAVVFLIAALLFLLFRINPGDLFRKFSDHSEQARQRREERQLQREQEAAAQEAQQNRPAPVVQELPIQPPQPGQTVQVQETVYATPDYYHAGPIYDTAPAYAPQPVQDANGFYPVTPDLYDERPPLHETPAPAVWENQQDIPASPQPGQQMMQQTVQNVPVPEEEEKENTVPPRFRRRRYHENAAEAAAKTGIAPEEEKPQDQPAVPLVKTQEKPKDAAFAPAQQQTPSPAARPAAQRPVPVTKPPLTESIEPMENDEDDLPWEVPAEQARTPAAASRPKESQSAKSSASDGDWAAQVRRKQEEARIAMPAHTTAKHDPKPVYTDPVMPITDERIPITPKRSLDESKTKLDGTMPPKAVKQMGMNLDIPYEAPPIRLLKEGRQVPQEHAAQEDESKAQIIETTLRSFGVESEVKQIMHGPAITRFAIQIAPGVKVSRVSNTADNLALELKSKHVRVEAPIQGTNYIGIEVPNQLVSTVSLREVLDSPEMRASPSPLMVALGKDIAGAPILCDLSKMPHLLIAGATGSGKSVCINSIVCSLLYRTSPSQVRLIMIDPKQVELSVYNSIPHLLVPVVSDPRKAAGALSWVVQEMLERYGKFSAESVRNLAGYNKVKQGTDEVLPNIVVIIDEMADLMEVCRKDVEESIRRLAALARAAGIYMVLATQRPSVDVITGVIKNNIPSRIAFAVSSGTDSRTIIDINGAEKLMGKGDMLYKPAGTSPVRVQGCFVSDDEVNAVTEYIASRYQTNYDVNIVEHLDNAGKEQDADETTGFDDGNGSVPAGNGVNEGEFSDLLQQAIEMAVEDGQTSTSMLQRRLRVGYARAGRLIDEMEKRGIISQSEGSKPRKTLITREQYYELMRDDH